MRFFLCILLMLPSLAFGVGADTTRLIIKNSWISSYAIDDDMGPWGDAPILTASYGGANFGQEDDLRCYRNGINAMQQTLIRIDSLWHDNYIGPNELIATPGTLMFMVRINANSPQVTLHRVLHTFYEGTCNNCKNAYANNMVTGDYWNYHYTDTALAHGWCSRHADYARGCYSPGGANDTMNTYDSADGHFTPYVDYDTTAYDSLSMLGASDGTWKAFEVPQEYIQDCYDDSLPLLLMLQIARSQPDNGSKYVFFYGVNCSLISKFPYLILNHTTPEVTPPDTVGEIRGSYIRGGRLR